MWASALRLRPPRRPALGFLLLLALWAFGHRRFNAVAQPAQAVAERPYGIEKRIPWTTSRITGSPDPAAPYRIKRVFPKLTFSNAVDFINIPGIDRLLVAELGGRILSFRNNSAVETPDLFVDLKKEISGVDQLFGVTFHPRFEENRYVYVCYALKSDLPKAAGFSLHREQDRTACARNQERANPDHMAVGRTQRWLSEVRSGRLSTFQRVTARVRTLPIRFGQARTIAICFGNSPHRCDRADEEKTIACRPTTLSPAGRIRGRSLGLRFPQSVENEL